MAEKPEMLWTLFAVEKSTQNSNEKERARKLEGKSWSEINAKKQENQLHINYKIIPAFLLISSR